MIRPNATSADGLTFHMIDVYVDELTKVGGGVGGKAAPPRPSALNQDAVFDFLRPYVVFCLKEKNRLLVKAVVRSDILIRDKNNCHLQENRRKEI